MFQGLLRLWSSGVVGIGAGIPDDALLVDDVGGRQGQGPTVLTIAYRQIDAELEVDFLEINRQAETQPQGCTHVVAGIVQDFKVQLQLFDQGAAPLGQLRGDSYQIRSGIDDLIVDLVQSLQLCIAVGSPITPKESQNRWAFCTKGLQTDRCPAAVLECEIRGISAHANDMIEHARFSEFGGGIVHRRKDFWRCLFFEAFSDTV